jgi:hypothetical protein
MGIARQIHRHSKKFHGPVMPPLVPMRFVGGEELAPSLVFRFEAQEISLSLFGFVAASQNTLE